MNMMTRLNPLRISALLATAAALLLFAACDDDPVSPGDDTEATTLSVYLTDAPGEVADVWVEVTDVHLVGEGDPISLLDEPTELINLLELEDQSMILIDEIEIEEGSYSQLRFVIDAAVLETIDGAVYSLGGAEHPGGLEQTGDLHCPSCAQSGLKVNFAGGLDVEEGDNAVLVDFDVSQSFGRQAGQSGRWVMRPVIQGTMVDPGDMDPDVGMLTGEVVLATDGEGNPIELPTCAGEDRSVEDFVPVATSTTLEDSEGDPFTFAGTTSAEGDFQIEVLEGDNYTLTYRETLVLDGWELQWDAAVTPGSADITVGETTSGVEYTINGAVCVESD